MVAAGGDGTLHVVAQRLRRLGLLADAVLGLSPLGTGNDLARTVGIPLDPRATAAVVLSGRPRPLDLLVDDRGGVAVNAVHCGVGGVAVRHAAPLEPWLGGRAVHVETGAIPCVADGDDCGSPVGPTWSVHPAAWRLLVPQPAPEQIPTSTSMAAAAAEG